MSVLMTEIITKLGLWELKRRGNYTVIWKFLSGVLQSTLK